LQGYPRYRPSRRATAAVTLSAGALMLPLAARAQIPNSFLLDQYFSQGVPGYGTQLGTTVLTRERPEYDPLGIRVSDFILHPELDESVGYNSNLIGQQSAIDSFAEQTSASLRVGSDWKRNSLGGELSVTNQIYPALTSQNQTSWSIGAGGTYEIGRDVVSAAVTHLRAFLEPYGVDVVTFNIPGVLYSAPLPYDVNDVRLGYTSAFGRLSLTPAFEFTNVSLGTTTYYGLNGFVPPPPVNGFVAGAPENASYLNHNVYLGSLTARYEYAPLRNFLFVVRGADISYKQSNTLLYGPNRSGSAFDALVGLDYTASGVWRYRALVGYEWRQWDNYSDQSAPVFEVDVYWQPSGLDTVTLRGLRTIQDATNADVSGYTYDLGRLQWDHELRRNILLTGYGSIQNAAYPNTNNGSQIFFGAGASATYLMNRMVHVALTYDWINSHGQNGFGANFAQNVVLLQFRLGL